MTDKKLKKIWDNFDDKTKASIKFLINELTQEKYQKIADALTKEKEVNNGWRIYLYRMWKPLPGKVTIGRI